MNLLLCTNFFFHNLATLTSSDPQSFSSTLFNVLRLYMRNRSNNLLHLIILFFNRYIFIGSNGQPKTRCTNISLLRRTLLYVFFLYRAYLGLHKTLNFVFNLLLLYLVICHVNPKLITIISSKYSIRLNLINQNLSKN